MDTWLDLHMHSHYSMDGEFEPGRLMELCAEAGLKAVALADHNAVAGIAAARCRAHELGLRYLSALEIDCLYAGRTFHLLGYGINETDPVFIRLEQDFHQKQRAAGHELMRKIKAQGFQFEEAQVMEHAVHGEVVAEQIAEVLLADARNAADERLQVYRAGGSRSDNSLVNFFWDYCADGKPCCVPIDFPLFTDMAAVIKNSGGVAVLAHPGINIGSDRKLAEGLIAAGIDGIEAFSNYHEDSVCRFYQALAEAHGLIVTAGSDFHGKCKPSIHHGELPHPYPQETCERLNQLIRERGGHILA